MDDGHGHLAHDAEAALEQQVERMRDRAVRVVFDRNDAEAGLAALDRVENGVEVGLGNRLRLTSEEGPDGLLGEGPGRPEKGDDAVSDARHGAPRSHA